MKQIIFSLLLLLLTLGLFAGEISGTVLDEDNNPIGNATVMLMQFGGHGGSGGPNVPVEFITEEDGIYVFPDLELDVYHITAFAEGYIAQAPLEVELTEETPNLYDMDILLVQFEEPESIGSITGVVVDEAGNLIAGAEVHLMGNGNWHNPGGNVVETNEAGEFLFDELPAGVFTLVAFDDDYMHSSPLDVEVTVENPDITGIEIILTSLEIPEGDGVISGIVTDIDNNPIAGVAVVLMGNGQGGWGHHNNDEIFTAEDGSFSFTDLSLGMYHIFAVADEYFPCEPVDVELTEETPEVTDVVIVLEVYEEPEPIGSIGGIVVDQDEQPIAGAVVFLMGQGYGWGNPVNLDEIETGEDGTFLFENLPADVYHITAFADDYMSTDPIEVEITEENPDVLDLVIMLTNWDNPEGDGLISGQVVNQQGEGIQALVMLTHQNQPVNLDAETDENGYFSFTDLPWGHYYLNAIAEGYEPGMLVHPNGEPATIHLTENHPEVEDVIIELYPEGGGYEGICELTILIENVDNSTGPVFVNLYNNDMNFVYEEVITENSITIDYLTEGDYYVAVHAPGYVTYFYEDATTPENATIITLSEANPVSITIDLEGFEVEEYDVSGQIIDNEGNPVAEAMVNFMPVDAQGGWGHGHGYGGWNMESMVFTDAEGYYTMTIMEGEYLLSAFAPQYTVTFWPGTLMMDQAEPLVVDQNLTDIDLTLYPMDFTGFSISGNVTIEDETPGVQVMVVAVSSDEDEEDTYMEAVMVGSEGDYEIPLDFDGEYYVMAITAGAFPMFFSEVYDWEEAQLIEVNGVVEDIDFNLFYPQSQGIENVSGVVTDENNAPLSGVTVIMSDDNGMPIAFGSTNSSGQYNIAFLGDMDYTMVATKIYYESYVTLVNPANNSQIDVSLNPTWMTGADENDIPDATAIIGNYPNPFNPETNIQFTISENNTDAKMIIFNTRGQRIKELVNDNFNSGTYSFSWKGLDDAGKPVSSGIYFYKLMTDKVSVSKKMILMK